MNNYVVYTGTFTKQDGTQRTMEVCTNTSLEIFHRVSLQRLSGKIQIAICKEGYEIVFDIRTKWFPSI